VTATPAHVHAGSRIVAGRRIAFTDPPMTRITAVITATSSSQATRILDALQTLMVTTRLEPGCLGCVARQEEAGNWIVHYEEEWETEADLRRRVRSDRFTSILSLLEASIAPPDIQFDFVTTTRGLDYVAAVRQESRMLG
jgi:quinol monooxygenase YgiN